MEITSSAWVKSRGRVVVGEEVRVPLGIDGEPAELDISARVLHPEEHRDETISFTVSVDDDGVFYVPRPRLRDLGLYDYVLHDDYPKDRESVSLEMAMMVASKDA